MTQASVDQIKVLERRRDDILMRIQDRDRSAYALDSEARALTAILAELRASREGGGRNRPNSDL